MKKNPLVYMFFIVLFFLSIIDIITPMKKFSEIENRNLRTMPTLSFKNILDSSFSKKYDEYVNDQFIGRDFWINLKSRSEHILGKIENNNIIYGKNDFMFEKFTVLDTNRIQVNVESIKSFINNTKQKVSLIIVPNSYEIYNENIPSSIPLINQKEQIEDIYKNISNSNVINLYNTFNENKYKNLYYKTDHHWTTYGAYLAYSEFVRSLGENPVNIEDLKENKIEDFYGTYYSKAKPYNAKSDTLSYYDFENVTLELDEEKYNSLYDYSQIEKRDKYSIFLRGNNPLTIIKNNENKSGKKILIFKDSYANSMIPFLSANYEEIHVIDLRSFSGKVSEYIKENTFDDILILYNFIGFSRDADILKIKL
ncbi:MAG: DHHW family protein [Clostridium sp.]